MIESLVASALLLWTPLALAATGGLLNRVGGIVNIGLEGHMLAGALTAALVSGAAGDWLAGVAAAAATGALLGLLMSLPITRLGANPIVVGLGYNIMIAGVAGYLLSKLFGVSGTLRVPGLDPLPRLDLPFLAEVPVLGVLMSGKDPLFWLAVLALPAVSMLLRHTRAGLRLRAAGAGAETARSLGLPATRIRDQSSVLAGLLAGVAGAQLCLGQVGLFHTDMVAGRGFIALAAFYFGRSRPLPTAAACLLFAFFDAGQARVQTGGGAAHLLQTLPYLVVAVVLTVTGIRESRRRTRRAG
ncbi:ABC transporter permease [Amycolatopsis cihanbeyliensis]|uniref:Nucleoside ABC transporter membrane protein n=1 Tax=Amycolatopsis cihanbeyliensis TaxID=1128664 RepID=A0A542DCX8_AMYCI|nr:ABC transporter permease [Amycolatopsis cihanbeyliensis]TQJ00927.1 nucleoside ABC transporter membrane protein [Amycolatopsis cihanbeyliensis]